jgi:peptidoglycan/LPS O-acetylase OafA/YrhL
MLRLTKSAWLNVVVVAACFDAASRGASWQVVYCLAFFYIGGLAAIMRRAIDASRYRTMIEAGAWLAAVAVPPAVIHAAGDQLDRISFPLFLGTTPLLLFCLSRKIAAPGWMQAMIVAAGNMTYSSYLLHFPIQLMIVLCFTAAGHPVPVYSGALFAVYLLTTLLLSYVTFRFFEAPAQRLIRGAFRRSRGGVLRPASSA